MGIFTSSKTNNYFSSYIDIKAITAPSSPNSGIGRLFHRSSDNKLCFKLSNGTVVELGGGAGTVTSASNVGLGSGWFKTLNGTDLEFKSLIAGSTQLSITSNVNDLTLDVVEANIKLDDLGAPDDNTDLNASATKHGLLPKLSGNSTDFLTGQGTWAVPAGGGAGGGTIGGTSTQSGDASTTVFTIAHGLGVDPNAVSVEASSIDALGDYQVDHDATNITITYQSAPPSGTNNLSWIWMANVGGAGEANTYSNAGAGGVGIVLTKTGVNLPFKSINTADSNNITVTNDAGNNEIDLDIGTAVLTTTNTKTITNKTVDSISNTVKNIGLYLFTVFTSGGTTYCRNNWTGAIDSSNANPTIVIQYAIDNANGESILLKSGTYLLTTALDCIDENFRLVGEGMILSANVGTTGDTILKADYTDASGALINCVNTAYSRQQFKNLVIDCNDTVAIGIHAVDIRERYHWLENVAVINCDDTGIKAAYSIYSTCSNVVIADCTNKGLWLYNDGSHNNNTFYWYGGRFTTNGINVQVDTSTDVSFNQIVIESGVTNNVKTTAATAKQIRFRDCSFEWHPITATNISCDDAGRNITYDNCRFDSSNTPDYYPITVRSGARQVQFVNCKFQANNASTTAHIDIESGAQDTMFIGCQEDVNIAMTISITDAGTRTMKIANSQGFGTNQISLPYTQLTSVPSTIVKTDQTNTFGSFDQTIPSGNLKITNGSTGAFAAAALSSNRTWTMPNATGNVVLDSNTMTLTNKTLTSPVISTISNIGTITLFTATDTVVGRATTDTLTNKTVNMTDNTVTDTSTAAGDLAKSNGTKFVRFARGTAYGQVARVNSGATDIEYGRQALFPSNDLFGTQGRRHGLYMPSGSGAGVSNGWGILGNLTVVGTVAINSLAYADRGKANRFTTAASTGALAGYSTQTTISTRGWNPRFKARFRLNGTVSDMRFFIGWNNTGGTFTTDDPLNAKSGIAFGKTAAGNFVIFHNISSGGSTQTVAVATADTDIHTIEIRADDAGTQYFWSFDGGVESAISTNIPQQTLGQGFAWNSESVAGVAVTYDIFWIEMESD